MIPVHVGEDHVTDLIGLDPEPRHRSGRRREALDLPARDELVLVEPRVDERDAPVAALEHPDHDGDVELPVLVAAGDQVGHGKLRQHAEADGEDLVGDRRSRRPGLRGRGVRPAERGQQHQPDEHTLRHLDLSDDART